MDITGQKCIKVKDNQLDCSTQDPQGLTSALGSFHDVFVTVDWMNDINKGDKVFSDFQLAEHFLTSYGPIFPTTIAVIQWPFEPCWVQVMNF